MTRILISDPTLRDGNHAVQHKLSLENVAAYAAAADAAGVPIVEVGHGNGLAALFLAGRRECGERQGDAHHCAREPAQQQTMHPRDARLRHHLPRSRPGH